MSKLDILLESLHESGGEKGLTLKQAEKLGELAYYRAVKENRSIVPAQDKNFMSRLTNDMPIAKLAAAWSRGYHAALQRETDKELKRLGII